ncbi:putative ORFan [Tupanvirus deep ocean]|uniref:ORFan n=2 Tax=Tupanvirus TaxID=2094720 RepID=A0AC62A745_9VIRU|nr:putative ORFan [Tupanvirus deep ocean]QKU33610.1 putative ORFan [Tupanvirus deep ocean]
MLLYGPQNERTILFDPVMNVFTNGVFIVISLVLINLGYWYNIYPLLMFMLSLMMCHLSDTLIKVFVVSQTTQNNLVNITYILGITTFLLWFIGSFFVVMNIIIEYTRPVFIFGCVTTFVYGSVVVLYFSALASLSNYHFLPPPPQTYYGGFYR